MEMSRKFEVLIFINLLSTFSAQSVSRCFFPTRLAVNGERFCAGANARLIVGDFDGNGQDDLLCRNLANGRYDIIQNMGRPRPHLLKFCKNRSSHLFAKDIDGDGKTDLVCQQADGSLEIEFSSKKGRKEATRKLWKKCNPGKSSLLIGDYDNDKKREIICYRENHFEVFFVSNVSETRTMKIPFCNEKDSRIYAGNFNQDGKVDFLCHNQKQKKFQVLYSPYTKNKIEDLKFKKCVKKNAVIRIADLNGDGIDDVICLQPNVWNIHIMMSQKNLKLIPKKEINFCFNGGEQNFFVGDFNSDRNDDMLCHTFTGVRQLAMSFCKP